MYKGEPEASLLTTGYIDHLFNDVYPRDQLSNWVLHLQSGIHLQEIEVTLRVHQKLTCTYM